MRSRHRKLIKVDKDYDDKCVKLHLVVSVFCREHAHCSSQAAAPTQPTITQILSCDNFKLCNLKRLRKAVNAQVARQLSSSTLYYFPRLYYVEPINLKNKSQNTPDLVKN